MQNIALRGVGKNRGRRYSPEARCRGATLIVALMFLVVMTMLVMAASQTSVLEERMSGYARDRSLAYQTVENLLSYIQYITLPNLNVDQIGTGCVYSQANAPSYRSTAFGNGQTVCLDTASHDSGYAINTPKYYVYYKGNVKYAGADNGFADVWANIGYATGMNPSTYVLIEQTNLVND